MASDPEALAARNIDRALRPRFYGDGFLETVRVEVKWRRTARRRRDAGANADPVLCVGRSAVEGPVGTTRLSRRGASFKRSPLWFCENSGFDLLYATDGVGSCSLELGCAPTKDALLRTCLGARRQRRRRAINALAPYVDVPRIHEERARLDALASQAAQRRVLSSSNSSAGGT